MANMWLLFETKQQQQIVLWWQSHKFGVAMFSPAWIICIICVSVYDFNHLPYCLWNLNVLRYGYLLDSVVVGLEMYVFFCKCVQLLFLFIGPIIGI